MRSITALTALAVALAATPAGARTWQQSWEVTGNPRLQVSTNDARVHVHPGPPGRVSAVVNYEVTYWGWRGGAHEPDVVFSHTGTDQVTISARARGTWVLFGGISERFSIDVTVPAQCDVDVRSGDGSVLVDSLAGHFALETGDGHLRAGNLRGEIELRTGDGGIDAAGLDGSLLARSGDGHLRVGGRFDHLQLRTTDGRLDATIARGSKLADAWDLQTGDGSMLVRIPRGLQAVVDATTGDGALNIDLPVTVNSGLTRHSLRGQINGGSQVLHLRTADGSLTLALSE